MRQIVGVLLVGGLLCFGCGSSTDAPEVSSQVKRERLEKTVGTITGNPAASSELKSIAGGVNQQLQNDKAVDQFSRGQ